LPSGANTAQVTQIVDWVLKKQSWYEMIRDEMRWVKKKLFIFIFLASTCSLWVLFKF
jgi:hypothetical protein